MKRQQSGHIFKKNGSWFGRWWDDFLQDGQVVRKQRCVKLADVSDRYRTKADVRPLLVERIRPINERRTTPAATLTVVEYGETFFLPRVDRDLKPSTASGYRVKWKTYLRPALGELVIRDARCVDVTNVLADIHRVHGVGRKTLSHCKAILRSLFTYAKQQGVLDGENPAKDAGIPRQARSSGQTHAYSPEEVLAMLNALNGVARTAIALMFFGGLRPGEARALRWEDYDAETRALHVKGSMWRKHLTTPKTEDSCAPIPVGDVLAAHLDAVPRTAPYILSGATGGPVDLKNLSRRVVKPALKRCVQCAGPAEEHPSCGHAFKPLPQWHGWYALRRGLATLATSLDTPLAASSLLRHRNVRTTEQFYIKRVQNDAQRAMEKIDALCGANVGALQN